MRFLYLADWMTRLVILVFFFFDVSLLVGCTKSQDSSAAAMIASATALDQQMQDAYRKKDLEALMAIHWKSPDLVVIDAHRGFLGWDAVKEAMQKDFDSDKASTYALRDTKYIVQGDVVLSRSRFLYRTLKNGVFVTTQGWATDVKAIREGKMVIVMVHIDSDPATNEGAAL